MGVVRLKVVVQATRVFKGRGRAVPHAVPTFRLCQIQASAMALPTISVGVWSDIACPWVSKAFLLPAASKGGLQGSRGLAQHQRQAGHQPWPAAGAEGMPLTACACRCAPPLQPHSHSRRCSAGSAGRGCSRRWPTSRGRRLSMYSGGPSCSTQPSQKRVLPSSHCWCWLAGPPLRRVATLHCVPPSCNGRLNAFAGEHIEAYYLRR